MHTVYIKDPSGNLLYTRYIVDSGLSYRVYPGDSVPQAVIDSASTPDDDTFETVGDSAKADTDEPVKRDGLVKEPPPEGAPTRSLKDAASKAKVAIGKVATVAKKATGKATGMTTGMKATVAGIVVLVVGGIAAMAARGKHVRR